jgi:hypothetical protein
MPLRKDVGPAESTLQVVKPSSRRRRYWPRSTFAGSALGYGNVVYIPLKKGVETR